MTKPDPEVLRELLRYDPETGKLYWRKRDRKWFNRDRSCQAWNTKCSGEETFTTIHRRGYLCGTILAKTYLAHQVIWAMVYNEWSGPKSFLIDHIDRNKKNNCLSNLRRSTPTQNVANSKRKNSNTSGYIGVWERKPQKSWVARIRNGEGSRWLGQFMSPEEAARAYDAAARELHGEFASLNFPDLV